MDRLYRSLLFALIIVACTGAVHAQTKTQRAEIQWSEPLDVREHGSFLSTIDRTSDAIYLLMAGRDEERMVQRLDLAMNRVYQKPIELKLGKTELELEDVRVVGDRIIVFASTYDKKADRKDLYVRVHAVADMAPLTAYSKEASIGAERRKNQGDFDMAISPDGSKVLVYVIKPYAKEGYDRFGVKVFTTDLVKLWENDIEMPYGDSEFSMEQMQVDNDGSVICVGVKYASKRDARMMKRQGKVPYDYHVLVYWKDQDLPVDERIEVQDKFLQDLTLSLGNDGDVLCAGFYSDKGAWSVRGTFFLRIDRATKTIVHQSFKEFDKDFITSYMTEKEERKAERKAEKDDAEVELYNYRLRDIIKREDGGALVLAEQYYMWVETIRTTNANGSYSTRTLYHYVYNDIIVVNVDHTGDIAWAAKVPKRQHSINDDGYYSSFTANVKGGRTYLIFNDSGENLYLQDGGRIDQFDISGKDALVTLATVDEDGITHREALFSPEKRDAKVCPKDCVDLGDGKSFLYASRKKEYRYGTVTFD